MGKKISIGDVFEITLSEGSGYGYCQILSYDKTYSYFCRVYSLVNQERLNLSAFIDKKPKIQFLKYLPLQYFKKQSFVKIGNVPVSKNDQILPIFKKPLPSGDWIIQDGCNEVLVGKILTKEQQSYPTRGLPNYAALVEYIKSGYTAEKDYCEKPIQPRNIELGDIYEIELSPGKGYSYCQFVGMHENKHAWGYYVRIFFKTYPQSQKTVMPELLNSPVQFTAIMGLHYCVAHGTIKWIGNSPVPFEYQKLPLFKAMGSYFGKRSDVWYLWDGQKETEIGETLTLEQQRYPTLGLYNKESIVSLIESGFRNGDDYKEMMEFVKKQNSNGKQGQHYKKALIKTALLTLLKQLENISHDHDEIFDTEVRVAMRDAINRSLIELDPNFQMPKELGMTSKQGNAKIHNTLNKFIEVVLPEFSKIGSVEERLMAFQNDDIETVDGNDYSEFFGYDDRYER